MSHSDVKKTFSAATRIPQWREVAAEKVSIGDDDRDAFLMVPGVVLLFRCSFSAMQLLRGCSHNEGPLQKHFFPSWVQQAFQNSEPLCGAGRAKAKRRFQTFPSCSLKTTWNTLWLHTAHWESQARKPYRLQGEELCFEYLGIWAKSPSHVILNSLMYYKRNGSTVTKGIHMQISQWLLNEWVMSEFSELWSSNWSGLSVWT